MPKPGGGYTAFLAAELEDGTKVCPDFFGQEKALCGAPTDGSGGKYLQIVFSPSPWTGGTIAFHDIYEQSVYPYRPGQFRIEIDGENEIYVLSFMGVDVLRVEKTDISPAHTIEGLESF